MNRNFFVRRNHAVTIFYECRGEGRFESLPFHCLRVGARRRQTVLRHKRHETFFVRHFLLGIVMTEQSSCVTAWPPPLEAYEYLKRLNRRDWAWEWLRRNPAYQQQASADPYKNIIKEHLGGGALFTRMQDPVLPAEAWALRCFC
jgi:hypothetical protein